MKRFYVLLISIILLGCGKDDDATPAKGTWTKKNDFPGEARAAGVSFSLNGKGYIGAGVNANSNGYFFDLWEYTAATDSWIKKNDVPYSGYNLEQVVIISGKAYLINSGKQVFEYNAETDKWNFKTSFPGDIGKGIAAFAIADAGYFGTGTNSTFKETKIFYKYQPATNQWTQVADFPGEARQEAIAFTLDNKGYVGFGYHGSSVLYYNDFWSFDPSQNKWTQISTPDIIKTATLQNFSGGTALTISNVGYVQVGPLMVSYEAQSDRWTEREPFPLSLSSNYGFTIGNSLYLAAGTLPNNTKTKQVYQYTP